MHLSLTRCRSTALILVSSALLSTPILAESSYADYLNDAYPADGPGATALVMKDGEVLFRGARGMANIELGVPLVPEHVFRLGSITKQFAGAAIMILQEEGKLSVEDEITKFLDDYPTHGHAITVEHLLTHTSGIASYTSIPGYMAGPKIRADLSTEELVDVFDDVEMDFSPGESWNYSNSGYVLLGAIVEEVSGLSFAEFVQQKIFDPLGMANSHYGGPQIVPRRVEGYNGTGGEYVNASFISMTQPHAAGSLLSTVDDLARWQKGFFGGKVLSAESVERMTTKFTLNDGEEVNYGYGFQISTLRGEKMISHGGGINGFATQALWLPDSKIFVAVLSNSPDNPSNPTLVAHRLAGEALGKPFPKPVAIPLPAEKLQDYVGVFRIDEEATRAVIVEDGKIYTQRTGSGRFEVQPYAEDAFFYVNSLSYIRFERDDTGKVTTMNMHPNGVEEAEVCPRLEGEAAELPDAREVADISPELYDLWAGYYQVQPGFVLELRRDGDRLMSQATGQAAVEIFPSSMHRFFLRVVPAEIEIIPGEDGRAEAIVIYQGGQEIRAERVEP